MSKAKQIFYDGTTDTYWIVYKSGVESSYAEEVPGVRVEYDEDSRVIGLEIQNYSRFFKLNPVSERRREVYAFSNIGSAQVYNTNNSPNL